MTVRVLSLLVACLLLLSAPADSSSARKAAPSAPMNVIVLPDYSHLKIAPPATGLYLGQYQWIDGDIDTFEAAAGMHTSHLAPNRGHWGFGYDGAGNPHLDVTQANAAWDAGRAIVVQAFNTHAGPDDEHPVGFTVDRLLRGHYDAPLPLSSRMEFGRTGAKSPA